MSIVRSVFRLHQQLVVAPLRICSCSYSRPTSSSRSTGSRQSIPISTPFLTRSYASKKGKGSKKSAAVEEEDDDSPVEEVRGGKERGGSGGKKGKGKSFNDNFDSNDTVGGGVKEAFDLKALELTMEEAVDKLRIALKSVVGRVGRVSPGSFAICSRFTRARLLTIVLSLYKISSTISELNQTVNDDH